MAIYSRYGGGKNSPSTWARALGNLMIIFLTFRKIANISTEGCEIGKAHTGHYVERLG